MERNQKIIKQLNHMQIKADEMDFLIKINLGVYFIFFFVVLFKLIWLFPVYTFSCSVNLKT